MIGKLTLAAAVAAFALPAMAQDPAHRPGEEAVDPYAVAEANAGVAPFEVRDRLGGPAEQIAAGVAPVHGLGRRRPRDRRRHRGQAGQSHHVRTSR